MKRSTCERSSAFPASSFQAGDLTESHQASTVPTAGAGDTQSVALEAAAAQASAVKLPPMPFPGPYSFDPLPMVLRQENPAMDQESRRPALVTAAQKGEVAVLAGLLAAGAEVNCACSQYGDTALTFAAAFGYIEVVRMLLAQPGVNMNLADHRGATALMYAVANDHTDVVACLLDAGAQVNLADKSDGDTALIQAARSGHLETFQMLLKHPGVDVDRADLCGETALFHAARRKNPAFVASLLEIGADMTVVNRAGDTALHCAIGKARAAVIEIFLLHGAQSVRCLVGTHRTDH